MYDAQSVLHILTTHVCDCLSDIGFSPKYTHMGCIIIYIGLQQLYNSYIKAETNRIIGRISIHYVIRIITVATFCEQKTRKFLFIEKELKKEFDNISRQLQFGSSCYCYCYLTVKVLNCGMYTNLVMTGFASNHLYELIY